MSGLLAASRALPRWQWGAPLPTQPDSAHPLCMTPLGWEVSLPPLPDAALFFSAPHRITRCIAGSRSPFPPSTTGTVQGEPGSSPSLDLWVSGKETGFRCLSRSLAATTLRPASPPLLFFPPCTGSLDQALLESFSESQGWGARPISGSARATRGKTNPRGGGQTA